MKKKLLTDRLMHKSIDWFLYQHIIDLVWVKLQPYLNF